MVVFSIKDTVRLNHRNNISFEQRLVNGRNISFELNYCPPDTVIHILEYMDDPKYEIVKVIDFRKID